MDVNDAELSDTALVVAVARERPSAMAELYRRHGGVCYRLALRLINDQRLAEDICQEVFLQLWNRPEAFDPERGSLRSWLLMKTHTKAVDIARSNRSRFDRENREINDRSVLGADLEREVWQLAVADRIQQALETLPVNERQAVRLAYFGGLTYREVATELGEPEGTVKSRIRSALRSLGKVLHDLHPAAGLDDASETTTGRWAR